MAGEATREIRRIAAVALAVFAAGTLAACGDSGSSTTDSSSKEASSQPASKSSEGKAGSKSPQDGDSKSKQSDGSGESSSSVHVAPLKVSGGGSAQFRNPQGRDNSIQDFGEESDESELEEAATSLHDFYVGRAKEDWSAACMHLSETVVGQLKQLAPAKSENESCPVVLAEVTPPLPPAVQRETTMVDAGSLRIDDERGFLVYRGAEQTIYAIPMAYEDEQWKVGSLAPVPLQ